MHTQTMTGEELTIGWPSKNADHTRTTTVLFERHTRLIRNLIWLYLILWLVEGGLRRWFLPGLATPLLLVRDPLVLAIYFSAYTKNLFPANAFYFMGLILAGFTFLNALIVGHGNPLVAIYGVRCDFLHVPLIFVMARILRKEDIIKLAKIAVMISIPYTLLLVDQFYSPQSAWVNHGIGDSDEGAGFSGAMGHFRPPGTFSFISGPSQLYPLFTACWFALVLARLLPAGLMLASGVAILVAIPISISRSLFLNVAIVAIVGVLALLIGGRLSIQVLVRSILAAVLLPILASQLPAFQEGMAAFTSRWDTATTESGSFQASIIDRELNDLLNPFTSADFGGLGTGYSTNVGQKILTEEVGFGAAEGEWGRLLYDNGLFLGSLLVLYRLALSGAICFAAYTAWRHRSPEALVFVAATLPQLISGQWGQSSTLGSAVIGGGLALAAAAHLKTSRGSSHPQY